MRVKFIEDVPMLGRIYRVGETETISPGMANLLFHQKRVEILKDDAPMEVVQKTPEPVKRGRGRPRKVVADDTPPNAR